MIIWGMRVRADTYYSWDLHKYAKCTKGVSKKEKNSKNFL